MKKLHTLPIALAFAFSAQANAQVYFEHKLDFKLEYSYEGEYTESPEKSDGSYDYKQDKKTEKITNKVILDALLKVEGAAMGDMIKGWSIVLITDDGGDEVGVFLVKKNEASINVSEYLYVAPYDSWNESYKGKYNGKKDVYTEKGEWYGIGSVEMQVDGFEAVISGSSSAKYEYKDAGDQYVVTGLDLSGLVGEASLDGGDDGFVKGSVKAGKGKEITL